MDEIVNGIPIGDIVLTNVYPFLYELQWIQRNCEQQKCSSKLDLQISHIAKNRQLTPYKSYCSWKMVFGIVAKIIIDTEELQIGEDIKHFKIYTEFSKSGGLKVLTTKILQRTDTFLVFCNRNNNKDQPIFSKDHQGKEDLANSEFIRGRGLQLSVHL